MIVHRSELQRCVDEKDEMKQSRQSYKEIKMVRLATFWFEDFLLFLRIALRCARKGQNVCWALFCEKIFTHLKLKFVPFLPKTVHWKELLGNKNSQKKKKKVKNNFLVWCKSRSVRKVKVQIFYENLESWYLQLKQTKSYAKFWFIWIGPASKNVVCADIVFVHLNTQSW